MREARHSLSRPAVYRSECTDNVPAMHRQNTGKTLSSGFAGHGEFDLLVSLGAGVVQDATYDPLLQALGLASGIIK